MSAYLLTAPAAEPLSLSDAKNFLRVEHGDDDAIIASLIAAARNHVEALTRAALITQTWRLVLDRWPDGGRITPRIGPLRTIAAARVFDTAGEASAIDPDIFVIDKAAGVIAAPAWSLPPPGRGMAGIERVPRRPRFTPAPTKSPTSAHRKRCCAAASRNCRARSGAGIHPNSPSHSEQS
jgi:uncharacterized phiE125 gp8 family phage protein